MTTRLLLVDDDSTLLQFLSEYLQGLSYDIITAPNGAEALRLAYREHPHLVVLDVMMPGMDGWEVTARLREMSDIPIILITGKTAEADKLRGFRLGIDDYVTKPFSFAELGARIQAVLNRVQQKNATAPELIAAGPLTLDLDHREALWNSQPVSLTPTEFRLLEVLARAQGKAVAELDLIQAVWGANRAEETAAVRRYIWLLRQKVEEDPSSPRFILTVRGFGYRLDTSFTA